MTKIKALDLFAGTGWGVACQRLGIEECGVEIMPEARASREAAGMTTVYHDVWEGLENPEIVPEHDLLIASPPCQTFSVAGKGAGRKALEDVLSLVPVAADPSAYLRKAGQGLDDRTTLVLTPLAYAVRYEPTFIALEQVPSVLPVWEAIASELRDMGYSVVTGVLDAADYGVPQVRKRAVLLARRDETPSSLPEPEGTRKTMQESLGWGLTERPSPTITSHLGVTRSPSGTQQVYLDAIERGEFVFKSEEPVPSRVAKNGIGSKYAPNTVNITSEEGAVLQSYPRDFPFQGSKTVKDLQIGNAVPPLLAEHILRTFILKEVE